MIVSFRLFFIILYLCVYYLVYDVSCESMHGTGVNCHSTHFLFHVVNLNPVRPLIITKRLRYGNECPTEEDLNHLVRPDGSLFGSWVFIWIWPQPFHILDGYNYDLHEAIQLPG